MSVCYNGLQAIIKEIVGEHVVYIYCYAHTLNLVLSNSTGASVQVFKLFDNLEIMYNLFRKSQKIHNLFKSTQNKLKVISLKRVTTVRWSSREFNLQAFLQRFVCIENSFSWYLVWRKSRKHFWRIDRIFPNKAVGCYSVPFQRDLRYYWPFKQISAKYRQCLPKVLEHLLWFMLQTSYTIPSPIKQCCVKEIWITRYVEVMHFCITKGFRYRLNIVWRWEGVCTPICDTKKGKESENL